MASGLGGFSQKDSLALNALRYDAVTLIEQAKSGHPGIALGAAPLLYTLYTRHLRYDPTAPTWPNRDRFVLSAGHGSALLYTLLAKLGYPYPADSLQQFRKLGSVTPGHPEFNPTLGIEATTGPLGQGAANAVGMAIAERWLAGYFNRPGFTLVDHHTFALLSDGDMMEGVVAEAASLAGHLQLGKLTFLYDANQICLEGRTAEAFSENVAARFTSYGWQVLQVAAADTSLQALSDALAQATAHSQAPTLIIAHTTIGYGAPQVAGTAQSHGAPLGSHRLAQLRANLGLTAEAHNAAETQAWQELAAAGEARGQQARHTWEAQLAAYAAAHPTLAQAWADLHASGAPGKGTLPTEESLYAQLRTTLPPAAQRATRESASLALAQLAAEIPWLLGCDADLASSTKAKIPQQPAWDLDHPTSRLLRCGVREHAMGALANGIACHSNLRPFATTFLVFSDYMRPAVRLAALSDLPVLYVWSHDSFYVGEDGPTHQPIEQLASLRAIPNLFVFRPADTRETCAAWQVAAARNTGPSALVVSRQALPEIDSTQLQQVGSPLQGAYVVSDCDAPVGLIIATGSEVALALDAQRQLADEGISVRVVSMPCMDLFAQQSARYQQRILPPTLQVRVTIEAGTSWGWERYALSSAGIIALDTFGASGAAADLAAHFGFTAAAVGQRMRQLLAAAGQGVALPATLPARTEPSASKRQHN